MSNDRLLVASVVVSTKNNVYKSVKRRESCMHARLSARISIINTIQEEEKVDLEHLKRHHRPTRSPILSTFNNSNSLISTNTTPPVYINRSVLIFLFLFFIFYLSNPIACLLP